MHGIEIPDLLSVLADHNPNGTVQGLNIAPPNDQPPINVVRLSFQTMVFIGTGLALITVAYVFTWWRRRRLPRSRWFYRALLLAGPASLVALICGWITTEVGRQPWIVYEIMRTEQAVTDADGLPVVFFTLLAVYLSLLGAVIWLLRRLARSSPESEAAATGVAG